MGVSICQFLDMTVANVALPHMRTSLGAGMDTISWVLTSYIIAGAILMPLTGWIADRVGSRNLFLASTAGFVVTSMLCGAANSLTQMVIFRALQGVCSAFIGPLSQTIIYDINPPSRQPKAMALWGTVVMVAPISGPFIGGFLTDTLNWRWVFYVNLPVGIPSLVLLWWLLPSRPVFKRKLDIFGACTLGLGLGALQLVMDRGQSNDWLQSPEVVIELLIALCALWVFVVHFRSIAHPIFNRTLVADGNFMVALLFMAVLGVANVGLASVLPTMYQGIYGYSVMDTGLLMAPRGLGVITMMLVVNRLLGRVDARFFISIGYFLAAISMLMMTRWSLVMSATPIILSGYVQGLGLGLIFVPMNLIAFGSLAPEYRTDGATLMALFRNLGSSFGISVITTVIARNLQTSHADIAGHVTSVNIPVLDPAFTAGRLGSAGTALLSIMDMEVNRQALMIAYLDNFYLMFWMLLIFAPLAWLLRKPPKRTLPQAVPAE